MKISRKMVVNWGSALCCLLLLFLAASHGGNLQKQALANSSKASGEGQDIVDITRFSSVGPINATFLDGKSSLGQLVKDTEYVAVVRVKEQSQFSNLAIANNVQVEKVIKGTISSEDAIVFQLGSLKYPPADLLVPDRTYMLFLYKNKGEQGDRFHIVGGERQGIFWLNGDELVGGDPEFAKSVQVAKSEKGFQSLERLVKEAKTQ